MSSEGESAFERPWDCSSVTEQGTLTRGEEPKNEINKEMGKKGCVEGTGLQHN